MKENTYLVSFEEIFKPVEITFRLAGVPFNKNSPITLQFCFFHVFIFLVDFEECCYFLTKIDSGDILEITSLIPCVITGVVALIKFTCLFLKRDKIIKLKQNLADLYIKIRKDEYKAKIVKRDVNFLKFITKYYSILNAALLAVYVVKDIIAITYAIVMGKSGVYPVPFAILLPLPIDNFYVWLFAYLQCSIGACICITYVVGSDVLYCVLTSHVCLNMSVISYEIENIPIEDIESLKDLVKYHQHILELCNDLEDIFTGPNFYNYLSASTQICVLLFLLSIVDVIQIPQYLLFIGSILLQLFLMSIFGEKLLKESDRIREATYLIEWYNMDKDMKKILKFIRERTKRPQKLTAYNLTVISYASFSKVISSSWSYFTLLNTVYTPPESVSV